MQNRLDNSSEELGFRALGLGAQIFQLQSAFMYGNSGCVGGCAKTSSDAVVERSSRRHSSRRVLRGNSTSHRDWWATSSDDMDNNIANSRSSQRSTSSISGTSHNQESRNANNNASNTAFVNHALLLWQERRREWVGNRQEPRPQETREPVLTWTTTYEELLATSRPFPQAIPLPEMVEFLVDVWEQEGLYENLF